MPGISKATVKRLVKENSGVMLSDEAADEIVEILERKAKEIAAHAVANAKRRNRSVILEEDIEDYAIKKGG
jgi:histone H3/H4